METIKGNWFKTLDLYGKTPSDVVHDLFIAVGNIVEDTNSISVSVIDNCLQCSIIDSLNKSTVTVKYETSTFSKRDSLVSGEKELFKFEDLCPMEKSEYKIDMSNILFEESFTETLNEDAKSKACAITEPESAESEDSTWSPHDISFSTNGNLNLDTEDEQTFDVGLIVGEEVLPSSVSPLAEEHFDSLLDDISGNEISVTDIPEESAQLLEKVGKNGEVISKRYNCAGHKSKRQRNPRNKFKCRFCEKIFSQIGNKNVHERIHTGEKPFKCNYCDKSFAQSSGRKAHERIHTGEKPFPCPICHKTFNQLSSKRAHERVHSSNQSVEIRW